MSNEDPFAAAGTDEDPFASDLPQVSTYPKMDQLRGRLLLIKPSKLEENLLSSFSKPGSPQYQDRVTADVYVVDGPPVEGFDGENEFLDMYFSQDRLVKQLKRNVLPGSKMLLGRLDTFKEGEPAKAGNPWGLKDPTDDDRSLARTFWKARATTKPANPFA